MDVEDGRFQFVGQVADEFFPKRVRLPEVGDFVNLRFGPSHDILVDLLHDVAAHVEVQVAARSFETTNGLVDDANAFLDVDAHLSVDEHVADPADHKSREGRKPPLVTHIVRP